MGQRSDKQVPLGWQDGRIRGTPTPGNACGVFLSICSFCASMHVHLDGCDELSVRAIADPQFLHHWQILITCIRAECRDQLSEGVASTEISKYQKSPKSSRRSTGFLFGYRCDSKRECWLWGLCAPFCEPLPLLLITLTFANEPLIWCPVLPDLIVHVGKALVWRELWYSGQWNKKEKKAKATFHEIVLLTRKHQLLNFELIVGLRWDFECLWNCQQVSASS